MQLPRIILWVSALGFGAFGVAFTLFPSALAALVDIELRTGTARADFMATYGGLELGVAAFLWLCTRRDEWVRPGLLASALALSGFAATRALGIVIVEDPGPLLFVFLFVEIVGASLSLWGARRAAA